MPEERGSSGRVRERMLQFLVRVRETIRPFGNLPALLGAVWAAGPLLAALWSLCLLLSGLLPAANLWLSKSVVDRLPLLLQRGNDALGEVWPWAVGLVAVTVAIPAVFFLITLLETHLRERTVIRLQRLVLERAGAIPLPDMEQQEFYDRLRRAQGVLNYQLVNVLRWTVQVLQGILSLAAVLSLLSLGPPLLLPMVAIAALPAGILRAIRTLHQWRVRRQQTPGDRKMDYLYSRLTDTGIAKEIRLYGIGDYLLAEWHKLRAGHWRQNLGLERRSAIEGLAGELCNAVAYVVALVLIVLAAGRRELSLGDYFLLVSGLGQVQMYLGQLVSNAAMLHEGAVTTGDIFEFLAVARPEPAGGRPFPLPLRSGIVAEGLTFTYPGKEAPSLVAVTFSIRPGERIAIVGANGSGKTTLVKLLMGLYTPTGGKLRYDGLSTTELNLPDLRSKVGSVSQEFVRYQLTVRENIGFGRLEKLETEATIQEAAAMGGGSNVAGTLPKGLDAMLGKIFDGSELSGGQWQKLAISRAFMRAITGAEVLILDEPTSGLDPRAEAEVFARFAKLAQGKTAFLISHRLGSARIADRILLLKEGRLAEVGTHDELMARGGEYARLFSTQAKWYQEEAPETEEPLEPASL